MPQLQHLRPLATLLLLCAGQVIAADGIPVQTLFEKPREEGEYRIPGIVALGDGTVLVFCADRKGRGDFGHETTTVMRRSTDGGQTWGPVREITARPETDIHSGPVVYDHRSRVLFKFCRYWPAGKDAKEITNSKTYSEMVELGWIDHVQTSDDRGVTWTESQRIRMDYPDGVYSAATGNGVHGIQLSGDRMMIQGGYSLREGDELLRHCCIFASDDRGWTWQRVRDIDTSEINVIREFVMAERLDGEVYFNIRSTRGRRAIYDGEQLRDDDELRDVACHAGLAAMRSGNRSLWVFSHPSPRGAARDAPFSERRQRLVLRVSEDEGATWPREIVIHEQAAAYSDVALLADGTALVVFENGDEIGRPYQRISLARVPDVSGERND